MASGSRSPHNARIAFDCKDTWQSCCSALAPGVALNGPSMRSIRRCATSPLPPSVRLLPPSGRSPRSSAARRHRARHRGWRLHPHPEGPSHRAGAGERANGTALRAAKHAPVLRLHTNLPELARSGASPRRSTPWDPLSNRRQKLPSTGYIATIGNEPAQIPASPKQIRPVAILHPHLASRFPPEAENLPHKEVEIRAPRAMVVDRDPQTVLTVDGRAEMAATRPLAAAA